MAEELKALSLHCIAFSSKSQFSCSSSVCLTIDAPFVDGRWYGTSEAAEAKSLHAFHLGTFAQAARNSQANELLALLNYLSIIRRSGLRTLVLPVLVESRWLIVRVNEDTPMQPPPAVNVEVLYFTSDSHPGSPLYQMSSELDNVLAKVTALSYCLHLDGESCRTHHREAHHLRQRLVDPAHARQLSKTTHRIHVLNDLGNEGVHFAYALAAMTQMTVQPQMSMVQLDNHLSRVTVDQLRNFQHRLVEPLHSGVRFAEEDLVHLALTELNHVQHSTRPSVPSAFHSLETHRGGSPITQCHPDEQHIGLEQLRDVSHTINSVFRYRKWPRFVLRAGGLIGESTSVQWSARHALELAL